MPQILLKVTTLTFPLPCSYSKSFLIFLRLLSFRNFSIKSTFYIQFPLPHSRGSSHGQSRGIRYFSLLDVKNWKSVFCIWSGVFSFWVMARAKESGISSISLLILHLIFWSVYFDFGLVYLVFENQPLQTSLHGSILHRPHGRGL